jgi:hypothetical protein
VREDEKVRGAEYVPIGPVQIARKLPRKPARTEPRLRTTSNEKAPIPGPTKLPRSCVFVELEDRVKGHIYDCFSGQDLGLASDEERAEHMAGVAYTRHRSGMKQQVVIW